MSWTSILNCVRSAKASIFRYPIYELWLQAIRSDTGTTVLFVATMLSGCIGLIAMQQTSSRLTWSFARDNALVYSSRLSKVHAKLHVPVEALLVNAVVVLLIGCLYLASTTGTFTFPPLENLATFPCVKGIPRGPRSTLTSIHSL